MDDIERFTTIVADQFRRVHENFESVHKRFNAIDTTLGSTHEHLKAIDQGLQGIRQRLDDLDESSTNAAGFAKEIDHVLQRIGTIEQHLGLNRTIVG